MPNKNKNKAKANAAEMARRRAQSARDRKMGASSMGGAIQRAPVSISKSLSTGAPRYTRTAGGLRVAHSEKWFSVKVNDDVPANYAYQVVPLKFPWLQSIAAEYQHFKIHKINFIYRPKVGTDVGGSIVMAPYYDAQDPRTAHGANGSGFLNFLTSLPGAKQFASWAADSAGFLASQLVRNVFRVVGVDTVPGQNALNYADEARVPGYLCVSTSIRTDGGTGVVQAGDIWVDYDIELIAPKGPQNTMGLSMQSLSTTSTALDLLNAPMSGSTSYVRPSGTNSVTFEAPGRYCIVKQQTGTSILLDTDGDTLVDDQGDDVLDARIHNVYDVSAGQLQDGADASKVDLYADNGSRAMQVYFLDVNMGDVLTFDALTSGTLARTNINIFRCANPVVLRP